MKRLFREWMEAGGDLAVNVVTPDAARVNIGAEEAFADLCFHSVMVRTFTVKWFLDHGDLSGSDCARSWGLLSSTSSSADFREALSPSGRTSAEQLLRGVFKSTDVYLWILDVIPVAAWLQIKRTLIATRSSPKRATFLVSSINAICDGMPRNHNFSLASSTPLIR